RACGEEIRDPGHATACQVVGPSNANLYETHGGTMTQPAGWFNDPYGRYQQRYWNGSAWTEHVSTDNAQTIDPMGASTVIPFATPASAYTAPAAGSAGGPPTGTSPAKSMTARPLQFLQALDADARVRPAPRLSIALAGGGGALVAIGIAAGIIGSDGSRGRAIGAAAVILAVALGIRLRVHGQPDLRSAAVGAGVVGLATLGGGIVADDVGDGWAALIVGAIFLAAWVLPGLRGRPIMLGIGTLLMVAALGAATSSGGAENSGVLSDVPFSSVVGDQQVVFLLAAAVLFGLVWWLDRAGFFGVGTSLVVPALLSAFIGVAESTSNLDNAGAAFLIFAVGIVVCLVGSHGDRRATTWGGALLATIGVVGFFAAIMKPDSVGSTAGMFVISGVLLAVAPASVRAIRASRSGKGSAPSAPTATSSLPPPSF
ncbi:MAG: hypothetical protein JWN99_2208, partial [Ilumatobacteraceae bacterium]|nr:hypothetical protein [Ilumatobacteraceae bacterium]